MSTALRPKLTSVPFAEESEPTTIVVAVVRFPSIRQHRSIVQDAWDPTALAPHVILPLLLSILPLEIEERHT
jgi:hypothetical protein